jgi:hypothetical protein
MQERERSGVYSVSYGERLTPANADDEESYKVRRGKVSGYRDYLSDADIAYCSELLERYQYSALVEDALGAGRTSARLA